MAARKPKELKSASVDSKAAPGALETGSSPTNWADKPESEAYKAAALLYPLIAAAYQNQQERADTIDELWNQYNAIPDDNQTYSGNSQGYVPAVRDALNARAKRTVKQLFPASQRHVDALSTEPDPPNTQLSLLEHYIRKTGLKSTVRTDLIAGDVTGQWNLYIDWTKSYRRVSEIIQKNPIVEQIDGENVSDLGLEDPLADPEEELKTETICDEGPEIVAFADEDLAVVPPTAKSIDSAQCAVMRLRMSEENVQRMVDEGVFILPRGQTVQQFFEGKASNGTSGMERKNPQRKAVYDAGIRTEGTTKFLLAFEAYAKLNLGGKEKEDAIIYYCSQNEICGIIKMPYWGGKRPILSEPVDKITGSFKGRSKIEPVKYLQWNLNDFWNMGMDSAFYGLLPVFAADPLKNPNWQSMVIGLAAVWPIAPSDVKPIQFPMLYKDAVQLCDAIKHQIWESLEVNETMMGRMPAGRKNNQLMGAMQQEQQINISDHAERYEEVMLTPLVERLFEYDQQFRTRSVTVKSRGELGVKANMIEVEPQQWGERYWFRWVGTDFMMGQNRLQQQIAAVNVAKGIPPAMLPGYELSLVPFVQLMFENVFGAEQSWNILVDKRNMYTVAPEVEDEILHNGMPASVHEGDDDVRHLQDHMKAAALAGDPLGLFKNHLGEHMMQLQAKREKAMSQQQQMMKGAPGGPGGVAAGVAGTSPRPGAIPGGMRGAQNPAGAVQIDQMADGAVSGRG